MIIIDFNVVLIHRATIDGDKNQTKEQISIELFRMNRFLIDI